MALLHQKHQIKTCKSWKSLGRELFPALPLLGGIASLFHRWGAALEPGRALTAHTRTLWVRVWLRSDCASW